MRLFVFPIARAQFVKESGPAISHFNLPCWTYTDLVRYVLVAVAVGRGALWLATLSLGGPSPQALTLLGGAGFIACRQRHPSLGKCRRSSTAPWRGLRPLPDVYSEYNKKRKTSNIEALGTLEYNFYCHYPQEWYYFTSSHPWVKSNCLTIFKQMIGAKLNY